MREIKFRAYIKTLKWLVPVERINFDVQTVEVDLTDGNGDTAEYDFDEVELMQYTGLKDKNGTEIYEGDIITTDIKRPYLIVEFRDGCFMFNCNDGAEDYYDIMLPILKEPQTIYKYGEVIGNIYENPELLK